MRVHASCDWKKSRTFNDLGTQIQGLSRTDTFFKNFQGLEFKRKKFKDFQGCMGTLVVVIIVLSIKHYIPDHAVSLMHYSSLLHCEKMS